MTAEVPPLFFKIGAGKLAQQLREWATFPEDPGLTPITYMMAPSLL